MKNIVIMPNAYKDPGYEVTRVAARTLQNDGVSVYLAESLRGDLLLDGIHYYNGDLPKEAEAILVIGGDGSVLDAAAFAIDAEIPLIGLNLGRLGYLAEMNREEINSLSRLVNDDFERALQELSDIIDKGCQE